jgi:hypothetical protein
MFDSSHIHGEEKSYLSPLIAQQITNSNKKRQIIEE